MTNLIILAGFITLFVTLLQLPSYFSEALTLSTKTGSFFIYYIPVFFSSVMGLLMILHPSKIASLLAIKEEAPWEQLFGKNNVGGLVFVLGLYLAFSSVSDVFFHIANYYYYNNQIGSSFTIGQYNYPYFLATIVELTMAIVFVVYGRNQLCSK